MCCTKVQKLTWLTLSHPLPLPTHHKDPVNIKQGRTESVDSPLSHNMKFVVKFNNNKQLDYELKIPITWSGIEINNE